jgi:hypothetical protein
LAATQDKGVQSCAIKNNGKRQHKYLGIKLTEKAQAYVEKQVFFEEEEIF